MGLLAGTCEKDGGALVYAFDTTTNYLRCRTCGTVTPAPEEEA